MLDVDARGFGKGAFIEKQDLRSSGPRALVVKDVEQGEGLPDRKTGIRPAELILVFEDGSKLGLGARTNQDGMMAIYGHRTAGWVGQVVEVYFDPNVSNPFNAANSGGIAPSAGVDLGAGGFRQRPRARCLRR